MVKKLNDARSSSRFQSAARSSSPMSVPRFRDRIPRSTLSVRALGGRARSSHRGTPAAPTNRERVRGYKRALWRVSRHRAARLRDRRLPAARRPEVMAKFLRTPAIDAVLQPITACARRAGGAEGSRRTAIVIGIQRPVQSAAAAAITWNRSTPQTEMGLRISGASSSRMRSQPSSATASSSAVIAKSIRSTRGPAVRIGVLGRCGGSDRDQHWPMRPDEPGISAIPWPTPMPSTRRLAR